MATSRRALSCIVCSSSSSSPSRGLQPSMPTIKAAVLAFPLLFLCSLHVPLSWHQSRFGPGRVSTMCQAPTVTGSLRSTTRRAAAAAAVVAADGAASTGAAVYTTTPGGIAGSDNSGNGKDGYSALCVVAHNENPYIREWVEYHKCLGFSKIYLYDHNSSVPLREEISEHVDSGFVVYANFCGVHTKFNEGFTTYLKRFMSTIQGLAYADCIKRYGSRHTFLGFIDVDEFLVIYDTKINHVDELLHEYEQHPGLSIYWVLLGSSGHKDRVKGLVVDEYKACTPHNHKLNYQFKTFVNTRFKPTMYSPHRAMFSAPLDPITGLKPYMVDEIHNRVPNISGINATHTRTAVYHYVTKSLEDYKEKLQRGGGAGVTRPTSFFDTMNKYSKKRCEGAVETRRRFCVEPRPQPLSKMLQG